MYYIHRAHLYIVKRYMPSSMRHPTPHNEALAARISFPIAAQPSTRRLVFKMKTVFIYIKVYTHIVYNVIHSSYNSPTISQCCMRITKISIKRIVVCEHFVYSYIYGIKMINGIVICCLLCVYIRVCI